MKGKLLIVFLAVLLIGFSSASTVSELFSDDVVQIDVTLTQNDSTAIISLDVEDTSFDLQTFDNEWGSFDAEISDFLSGIDAEIKMDKGEVSPEITNIDIAEGSYTKAILDLIFSYYELGFTAEEISNNQTILNNYLQEHPLNDPIEESSSFSKFGNDYTFWTSIGYGDVNEDWKARVKEQVNQTLVKVSPNKIITGLIPILEGDISGVEEGDLNLFEDLDLDYSIESVDLSQIYLQDGDYVVEATINAGGEIITKNVNLHLEGIENVEEGSIVAGTFTPKNSGVKELINNVAKLDGTNSLFTVKIFSEGGFAAPSDTNIFTYLDMSVDGNTSKSAEINFYVLKDEVTNTEKVSLYVYENGEWVKQSTSLVSSSDQNFYEFNAFIPHFSSFMIGEDTSTDSTSENDGSSSSDGGSSSGGTSSNKNLIVSGSPEIGQNSNEGNILDLSNSDGNSGITGAAIGSRDNNFKGIIIALAILICIALILVVIRKVRN